MVKIVRGGQDSQGWSGTVRFQAAHDVPHRGSCWNQLFEYRVVHQVYRYLLDGTPDARDCADGSTLELGDLQSTVEHATHEGGVLRDL